MLSHKEQCNILNEFPNIELSYEKTTHKKVHYKLCLTIPKGLKSFIWFKYYKNNPQCFILKLNYKKNSITSIQNFTCCFNPLLCAGKGTIILPPDLIKLLFLFIISSKKLQANTKT